MPFNFSFSTGNLKQGISLAMVVSSDTNEDDSNFQSCDEEEEVELQEDQSQHPAFQEYKKQLHEMTETSMFDPDQRPEIAHRIRSEYLCLLSDVRRNKKEMAESEDSTEIVELIQRTSTMYEQVKKTTEATIDSSLLAVSADISTEKAGFLFKSTAFFSLHDYVSKLRDFLTENPQGIRNLTTATMLKGRFAHSFSCLYGPIKQEVVIKEPKRRQLSSEPDEPDSENDDNSLLNGTSAQSNSGNATVETTTMIVEVYELLQSVAPVNFFAFFINPHSFGQSVENLFYCSFLVREEKAIVYIDPQDQVPFIEAIYEEQDEEELGGDARISPTKNQIIMTLDWDLWQRAISRFNIVNSIIPNRK